MANLEDVIRIIAYASTAAKNLIEIFHSDRRKKILGILGKFANDRVVIIFNNILMYVACFGIISVGLAISIILLYKIELSALGCFVSIASFLPFALYSRFTFKIGYLKLANQ